MYLDHAAGVSGNASSPHAEGRAARVQVEVAREKIARILEVKADDIVFTSGATESNALAILGYVRAARKHKRNNAHVLYLPSSHASVVENMQLLREEGVVAEPLPIRDAEVDIEAMGRLITPNTILVSMDAVCGETGVVWNTREVSNALKDTGIRLHVDASQAPLTEKVTRTHFAADMLTFDLSKISQMRGLGVLVAHRTISIEPLYRGGGQERGLRPGSEVPELAVAFADALERAVTRRAGFANKSVDMRNKLVNGLFESVPDALINEGKKQAPNIVNISLLEADTDYLVALLDDAGFAVSTKSACETDTETGSRAVMAITGDRVRAEHTVRVSWGPNTREQDLLRFVESLKKALQIASK